MEAKRAVRRLNNRWSKRQWHLGLGGSIGDIGQILGVFGSSTHKIYYLIGFRLWDYWMTSLSLFTFMHWRRKWQPTPVFLPGESQGGGAWWAAVCGVAQSWTRLKRLSSSSSSSNRLWDWKSRMIQMFLARAVMWMMVLFSEIRMPWEGLDLGEDERCKWVT